MQLRINLQSLSIWLVCLLIGWIASRGNLLAASIAAVPLVGATVAVGMRTQTAARILAWVGLLLPMTISESRTGTDIAESVLSPITTLHAVVPVACLGLALLIRPSSLLPRNKREYLLCTYLLIAVVSALWSLSPAVTLLAALQLVVAFMLLLFITRSSNRPLQELASVVIGLVLVIAINFALIPEAYSAGSELDPTVRLSAVYPSLSSNTVGLVAAVSIMFMLTGYGPRWSQLRMVRWGLITMALAELLVSRTRSYFILLAAVSLLSIFLNSERRKRLLVVGPAVLAVAVVAFSLAQTEIDKFVRRGQDQASFQTLTGRTETWRVGLEQWQQQPVQGYGYFTGHRFSDEFHSLGREVSNLDSMWVETLLDLGLLGLIPLALLVILGFRMTWSFRRDTAALYILLLCLGGSFLNPSLQQVGYPMVIFGLVLLSEVTPKPQALPRTVAPKRLVPPLRRRMPDGSS